MEGTLFVKAHKSAGENENSHPKTMDSWHKGIIHDAEWEKDTTSRSEGKSFALKASYPEWYDGRSNSSTSEVDGASRLEEHEDE